MVPASILNTACNHKPFIMHLYTVQVVTFGPIFNIRYDIIQYKRSLCGRLLFEKILFLFFLVSAPITFTRLSDIVLYLFNWRNLLLEMSRKLHPSQIWYLMNKIRICDSTYVHVYVYIVINYWWDTLFCRTNHCVLLLTGKERELRLDEASFERAVALLRQVPEFTIAAVLYQDIGNAGTIVAFSHGNIGYVMLTKNLHIFS